MGNVTSGDAQQQNAFYQRVTPFYDFHLDPPAETVRSEGKHDSLDARKKKIKAYLDQKQIADVMEGKEKWSLALLYASRKEERVRVEEDESQRANRTVIAAQRKIIHNLQDFLLLSFLDEKSAGAEEEEGKMNKTELDPDEQKRKEEQKRISAKLKKLRAMKKAQSETPESQPPKDQDFNNEQDTVVEEDELPESEELDPPAREGGSKYLVEITDLYDSIFTLAEENLINADEEAKLYTLILQSPTGVLKEFRAYKEHKDLNMFVAALKML